MAKKRSQTKTPSKTHRGQSPIALGGKSPEPGAIAAPLPLPSTASLPIIPISKIVEGQSRTIFEDAMGPWRVTAWHAHDYGIDSIVEIAIPRWAQPGYHASGKRFAVQLKGTEAKTDGKTLSVDVTIGQLGSWLESIEQVVFAVVQVAERKIYWRWIDEKLVDELSARNPAWPGQETVSISIPTERVLDDSSLREIEKRVFEQRKSARRVFRPGDFFRLQGQASELSKRLTDLARDAGFESIEKRLAETQQSLRACTYVIAITGPSRVGKSTLLNALLRRDVSPIGRFPTTAVALMAVAADKNETEIEFNDRTKVKGDATADFIRQYADQKENPGNKKAVRLINVRLVSEPLERGIALVDAPGLHDASSEIRNQTKDTLHRADAFVYVLSAARMRDGEFELSEHVMADIMWLRRIANRLILVLNKADTLKDEERRELLEYVEATLKTHGLWDELPCPPMLLSAEQGWTQAKSGAEPEALRDLESAIWGHLLKSRSTGIDRLATTVTQLDQATHDFLTLLAARRANAAEAARLREAVATCRREQDTILADCRGRHPVTVAWAKDLLRSRKAGVMEALRQRLAAVPLNVPLPALADFRPQVVTDLRIVLPASWHEIRLQMQGFSAHVSRRVETSLQQARMAPGIPAIRLSVPDIVLPENFGPDAFREPLLGAVLGAVAFLINPLAGFFSLLVGAAIGAETSRGDRRKRDIERRLEFFDSKIHEAFANLWAEVLDKINAHAHALDRHVQDRMNVYFYDMERQLANLGPASPAEAERAALFESAIAREREMLVRLVREVGSSEVK